jgi:hypothetical protein
MITDSKEFADKFGTATVGHNYGMLTSISRAKYRAEAELRRSQELTLVRMLGKPGWENACRSCGREIPSGPRWCKACAFRHDFPQLAAMLESMPGAKPIESIEDSKIAAIMEKLDQAGVTR